MKFISNTISKCLSSLLSTLLIALPLLTTSSTAVFADTESEFSEIKAELREAIPNTNAGLCQQKMIPYADIELYEFLAFLDQHFSNKSSNSSLTNIAIVRYSDYKLNLESALESMTPGGGSVGDYFDSNSTFQTELAAYSECQDLVQEYIELGKERMVKKIQNTTAQKKTIILLEKYKSINSAMADLNFQISRMYGYLSTFEQKLPGFVRSCITK